MFWSLWNNLCNNVLANSRGGSGQISALDSSQAVGSSGGQLAAVTAAIFVFSPESVLRDGSLVSPCLVMLLVKCETHVNYDVD